MCMNIYLVTLLCLGLCVCVSAVRLLDVLCSCTHACPYPRTRGDQFSRVVAGDLRTDKRNRDRVAD
jgi:hypothetical protein